MSKLGYIDFDFLKSQLTIKQVLSAYGITQLKQAGTQLRGACPLHQGSNDRQFVVWPEKNSWRCFGACNRSGDIIQLVSQLLGISNHQAAHDLARRFDLVEASKAPVNKQKVIKAPAPERPAPANRDPCETRQGGLDHDQKTEEGNQAPLKLKPLTYLNFEHESLLAAGLSPETAKRFGVGYAPKGIMAGRIAIPIHSLDGELLAYAGAATKPHQQPWKYPKGFQPNLELFNAPRLMRHQSDRQQSLTLCFDPLEVLQRYEQTQEEVVALIGEAITKVQIEKINRLIDQNSYSEIVVLASDQHQPARDLFDQFINHQNISKVTFTWQRSDE